jgi:hypothetical protein
MLRLEPAWYDYTIHRALNGIGIGNHSVRLVKDCTLQMALKYTWEHTILHFRNFKWLTKLDQLGWSCYELPTSKFNRSYKTKFTYFWNKNFSPNLVFVYARLPLLDVERSAWWRVLLPCRNSTIMCVCICVKISCIFDIVFGCYWLQDRACLFIYIPCISLIKNVI